MIALALAAIVQAAPAFQPPLDTPIAYTATETRDGGAGVQLFTVERRVTFHRREAVLVAEVETLRVSGSGDAGMARLFESAMRAMVGRRVLMTLDPTGRVTDVANRDQVWRAHVEGMAAALAAPAGSAKAATVASLLAPLRALPPPQQVAKLAEMLDPLIGSDLLVAGERAARPVSVPARGRDGSQAMLTGSELTVREPDGTLRFERTVADAGSRLHLLRRVEPATGLVRETVETTAQSAGAVRLTITKSTLVKF